LENHKNDDFKLKIREGLKKQASDSRNVTALRLLILAFACALQFFFVNDLFIFQSMYSRTLYSSQLVLNTGELHFQGLFALANL